MYKYTTKIKLLLAVETIWGVWCYSWIITGLLAYFGGLSWLWPIASFLTIPAILATAKPIPPSTDVKKKRLPSWLAWASTPDFDLPGDFEEPTVERLYSLFYPINKKLAWFVTSWYWIGYRNVGHGILWNSGHFTPKHPQHLTPDELDKYGTGIKQKKVGPFWVMWGCKTVKDRLNTQQIGQGYWAVPWYSIRLKKRDFGGQS